MGSFTVVTRREKIVSVPGEEEGGFPRLLMVFGQKWMELNQGTLSNATPWHWLSPALSVPGSSQQPRLEFSPGPT